MAGRIEDYGLIGDCETAALVGRDGSIDWLCWPRFDSDACFAALLDDRNAGRWRIAPTKTPLRTQRRYLPDTLVLETTFELEEGVVQLVDFMPPRGAASDVVRLVRGVRGKVALHMELIVRFGYGAQVPWVTRLEDGGLRFVAGPDMVVLHTSAPLRGEDRTTVSDFELGAGDEVAFVLTYGASHLEPPRPIDAAAALDHTCDMWRSWIAQGEVDGPYSGALTRSLLTLKALTYAPTGGVVAAPTTSLPEAIGGPRNWDYRFCWIRDATLTLLAMMNAGFYDEAAAWRDWLLRAAAGAPAQLQIMYGIAGERRLTEWTVDWLEGYERSRPVRIGNSAHQQLQLDVYGELMDALFQAREGGLPENDAAWDLQVALMSHIAGIWREPDEGIWEVRGVRQRFTYSAVMAWVAFDRAIRTVERDGLPGPVEDWRRIHEAIAADVWAYGYDAAANHFTRSFEDQGLDASLLLLAEVGFVAPDHPAFLGTVAAIERELLVDGYVLRYDTRRSEDGLPPGEGAFLACSFWLADAYHLLGRQDEARALFERLLGRASDLGLLSEEYDPRLGRMTGNFPQAFSHVGLINTAFNLTRTRKPNAQRASGPTAETVASDRGPDMNKARHGERSGPRVHPDERGRMAQAPASDASAPPFNAEQRAKESREI